MRSHQVVTSSGSWYVHWLTRVYVLLLLTTQQKPLTTETSFSLARREGKVQQHSTCTTDYLLSIALFAIKAPHVITCGATTQKHDQAARERRVQMYGDQAQLGTLC